MLLAWRAGRLSLSRRAFQCRHHVRIGRCWLGYGGKLGDGITLGLLPGSGDDLARVSHLPRVIVPPRALGILRVWTAWLCRHHHVR